MPGAANMAALAISLVVLIVELRRAKRNKWWR